MFTSKEHTVRLRFSEAVLYAFFIRGVWKSLRLPLFSNLTCTNRRFRKRATISSEVKFAILDFMLCWLWSQTSSSMQSGQIFIPVWPGIRIEPTTKLWLPIKQQLHITLELAMKIFSTFPLLSNVGYSWLIAWPARSPALILRANSRQQKHRFPFTFTSPLASAIFLNMTQARGGIIGAGNWNDETTEDVAMLVWNVKFFSMDDTSGVWRKWLCKHLIKKISSMFHFITSLKLIPIFCFFSNNSVIKTWLNRQNLRHWRCYGIRSICVQYFLKRARLSWLPSLKSFSECHKRLWQSWRMVDSNVSVPMAVFKWDVCIGVFLDLSIMQSL